MPKYMILYNSDLQASELMSQATPEQMKASMGEWMKWRDEAQSKAKVEFGMPLQPVAGVTSAGTGESHSRTSGYSIVETDSKDAVIEIFKNHPHLSRKGSSIDVLEMLSMPGM